MTTFRSLERLRSIVREVRRRAHRLRRALRFDYGDFEVVLLDEDRLDPS